MCTTIAAATGGLSAASGILGFAQQTAAANRQNAYYEQNAAAANQGLVNSYAADQTQLAQERNRDSQDLFENEKKSVAAQGTALTAAGQAGVGGQSVDELLGDYRARYSTYKSSVDQNFAMDQQAMGLTEKSQMDGTTSRINSVQRAVAPSWLDAGLRIAGAVTQGFGQSEAEKYREQSWKLNGGAPPMGLYDNMTDNALGGGY